MRWLSIISSLDAVDGGPPQGVLKILAELSRSGDSTHVVAMHLRGEALAEAYAEAIAAGVRVDLVTVRRLGRFRFSIRYLRACVLAGRTADVVTAHGFYQWPQICALLAATRTGAFLQLQPHGVFEPYQEAQHRLVKAVYNRSIGAWAARRIDRVLAASSSELEGIRQSRRDFGRKVDVTGLGASGNSGMKTGFDRYDTRAVLYLARIAPKKRLDKLILAVAELEQIGLPVSLTICGDGDPSLIDEYKSMARRLGTPVNWLGHVQGAEKSRILESHGLFCLPSDNENFGQSVTEAMSAGLAIVTTTATASSAFVAEAGGGWILENPTVGELAATLSEALSSPGRLLEAGRRNMEYASNHLSWKSVARRWREGVPSETSIGGPR